MNEVQEIRKQSRKLVRELGFLKPGAAMAGIKFAQCHALIELEHNQKLTQKELAEILQVDKSAISRTTAQMLDQNLIKAEVVEEDHRASVLRLTAKGKGALKKIHSVCDLQVEDAMQHLNPSERLKVIEGLALYADALKKSRFKSKLVLRDVRPKDSPAIKDIIETVMTEFGACGEGFAIVDPEVQDMYTWYQQKHWHYFVLELDGKVVGGAGIAPLQGGDADICELKKMYFTKESRGLGLGQMLLNKCIERARLLGFKKMYLETLTRMERANALYLRNGFERLDRPMGNTGHHGCDTSYLKRL